MPVNNAIGTGGAALASVWTEALASIIEDIEDTVRHLSYIFPSDTDLTCTFTALAGANTYSTWAEIVDSDAVALTAAFASDDGHITSMLIEYVSEANTIYMLQLSYGASKTLISSVRFAGGTKFQAPDNQARFWAHEIPEGETVYYKMKTATSVADTCMVHFRYHLH